MIQTPSPAEAICTVRNALFEGTDAFGLQVEKFAPENREAKILSPVFAAMNGRPCYVTNYRCKTNDGKTDEELGAELLALSEIGGELFDVIGDLYDRTPGELTMNGEAIKKQETLIDALHAKGKQVLMSSHVLKYTCAEEVLRIALEHKKRGADVAKIVTAGNSVEEEMENLRITTLLKKELDIPFLFLSGGTHCSRHRMFGPLLGSCMYLAVYQHDAMSTKAQPLLRAARAVRDNVDW